MNRYLLSRLRVPVLLRVWYLVGFTVLAPGRAGASFLQGEALDSIANALSWVVLVLVPVVGITVFWLVHILPEKIAEKKKHPQTRAIQCLCLLSLVFGGLLWPLAWLWAYSKPVFYRMAYGTDVDESIGHGKKGTQDMETGGGTRATALPMDMDMDMDMATAETRAVEMQRLRSRLAELEGNTGKKGGPA